MTSKPDPHPYITIPVGTARATYKLVNVVEGRRCQWCGEWYYPKLETARSKWCGNPCRVKAYTARREGRLDELERRRSISQQDYRRADATGEGG